MTQLPSQFVLRSHYHSILGAMFTLKYDHQLSGNRELRLSLSHLGIDMGFHILTNKNSMPAHWTNTVAQPISEDFTWALFSVDRPASRWFCQRLENYFLLLVVALFKAINRAM